MIASAPPCVCIHELGQARRTLAAAAAWARPVRLLSAPGAASYAGCGWWRALMQAAAEGPAPAGWTDLLDCGDAAGHAMAALRIGQRALILSAHTPALAAVQGAAGAMGAIIVTARPLSIDLDEPGADRHLAQWLQTGT